MYPADYLYSKDHDWIRVEGDVGVLGITHFAQDELGEVVFVELPEVGDSFEVDPEIGTIGAVKAVAEIFTPVAGQVIEVNDDLVDDPAAVNDDPHDKGWLVKIQLGDKGQLEGLMSAETYEVFAAGEGS